jgi:hypothetical protein
MIAHLIRLPSTGPDKGTSTRTRTPSTFGPEVIGAALTALLTHYDAWVGWRRIGRLGAGTVMAASLVGCGGRDDGIAFDTEPLGTMPASSSAVPSTTLAAVVDSSIATDTSQSGDELAWTDVTGDLEGLDSECENVGIVASDAGADRMIASVAGNGLWSLPIGGDDWEPLAADASSAVRNRVRSLIFDPDDPSRMWVSGTAREGGVRRSDDAGVTFALLGSEFGAGRLSVDFADPDRSTLLAVDETNNEVLRSVDGGMSWDPISLELPYDVGQIVAALALDETTYLIGTRDASLSGVFRSEEGGATWDRVHAGGVAGSPLVRDDGSIVWLVEYGGGVIVSADNGADWQENDGGGVSWTAQHLVELPDGRLATFGLQQVLLTADEGVTWRPYGPALPFYPSGIAFSAADSAFYVWQSQCGFEESYPVLPESIMRLEFDDAVAPAD